MPHTTNSMDEIIKLIVQSLRSFKGYEVSKCLEHVIGVMFKWANKYGWLVDKKGACWL